MRAILVRNSVTQCWVTMRARSAFYGDESTIIFAGMDPGDDPELALALRMSMEEQRQRTGGAAMETETGSAADATAGENCLKDFFVQFHLVFLASLAWFVSLCCVCL